jgi:hypothetical protein
MRIVSAFGKNGNIVHKNIAMGVHVQGVLKVALL